MDNATRKTPANTSIKPKAPFNSLGMIALGAFFSLVPNLALVMIAQASDLKNMLGYYPVFSWLFAGVLIVLCIVGDASEKQRPGVRRFAFGALLMTIAMHVCALPRPELF